MYEVGRGYVGIHNSTGLDGYAGNMCVLCALCIQRQTILSRPTKVDIRRWREGLELFLTPYNKVHRREKLGYLCCVVSSLALVANFILPRACSLLSRCTLSSVNRIVVLLEKNELGKHSRSKRADDTSTQWFGQRKGNQSVKHIQPHTHTHNNPIQKVGKKESTEAATKTRGKVFYI